ncbi:hypothetical protein KVV02_005517, partial [Mortierella alpina]
AELKEINRICRQRYEDLLECARSSDTLSPITFLSADMFEIPMAKVCTTLSVKREFLDIFHYLKSHQEDFLHKISHCNFGRLIGCHIRRPHFRHYKLEQVLNSWLEEQRKQSTPVSAKTIKKAAAVTYTILATYSNLDERPDNEPSFTASWFTAYKKRHQISYCQLQGEAGSVDMVAIEPELVEICAIAAQFHPKSIVNCDETGMLYVTGVIQDYRAADRPRPSTLED